MLRTQLFKAFALLVLIIGILSAGYSIRVIQTRMVAEAQTRVRLNLGTAWAVLNFKHNEIATSLDLIAEKTEVKTLCETRAWDDPKLRSDLEQIRRMLGLDFMGMVSPSGEGVLKTTAPYHVGDTKSSNPLIAKALAGERAKSFSIWSGIDLEQESEDLSQQACLAQPLPPPQKPGIQAQENRGLVMQAATPIYSHGNQVGILYGGVLINRNERMVDIIHQTVFESEDYKGVSVGTVTLFLDDVPIASTARLKTGQRTLGNRASKPVAESVRSGQSWTGKSIIATRCYLSFYDPIKDLNGHVIGMLHVGYLKQPFDDMEKSLIFRYAGLLILGLSAALLAAFLTAGRLAAPIHDLVQASRRLHAGIFGAQVPMAPKACQEANTLIESFNDMAMALAERETRLTETARKLENTNHSLVARNRDYMDMLGFVSHELKTPIQTMMNYAFLLKQNRLGPLTLRQVKAVSVIDLSIGRISEMIRHYLNLSRIETGELVPTPVKIVVLTDIIQPILDTLEHEIQLHHFQLDNRIAPDIVLRADLTLTREVFENLLSNAVKYGRAGGTIRLDAAADGGMIRFTIWNEGEGIPPGKRDQVFKKFSWISDSEALRKRRGTGLGLFITRHIVEAHGGLISVESQFNEWVEFRFTLPGWSEAGINPGTCQA